MPARLSRARLTVRAAYAALPDHESGGVVVFVGRSRAERHRGRPVRALDYEADVGMALAALGQLEAEVRRRFGVRRAILWHRLGRVPIGEPSVIIGVATAHRAEAFAAARYLIDELKTRVPIWKSAAPPRSAVRRRRARSSPAAR